MFDILALDDHESRTAVDSSADNALDSLAVDDAEMCRVDAEPPAGERAGSIRTYSYFFRKTCPNCLPVREVVEKLPLAGTLVDVDSEEGLNEAMHNGVFSTPTVIFFDQNGKPVFQGHAGNEIEDFFAPLYAFRD